MLLPDSADISPAAVRTAGSGNQRGLFSSLVSVTISWHSWFFLSAEGGTGSPSVPAAGRQSVEAQPSLTAFKFKPHHSLFESEWVNSSFWL